MKTTTVVLLCAISGLIAGVAGIYGGIYLDRRAVEAYVNNLQADETVRILKLASAVSVLLSKSDVCGAQKLVALAINTSKSVVHDVRNLTRLEKPTLARLDEAMDYAAKAESAAKAAPASARCG